MKCPKCGYATFNYLDTCKKCGRDLTAFKAEHGLWGIKPGNLSIYSPVPQAMGQEGSHGIAEVGALSGLEDDLSHEIEMIGEEEDGAAFPNPLLQGSQEGLGEIRLDIEEIGLEEGEIELDSPDNEAFALELEEIRLEEAKEGNPPEDPSSWLSLGEETPSGVQSPEEAPEEVPLIDLDLEEIDLGGMDLAEAEPVLDLGEENKPDLLELDEIELSWEEEDSEKEEER